PAKLLDDKTERDIIDCLTLGQQSGYNQIDVWGLFATSAYPIDIRSAFRDEQRRPRVDRILRAARERGIKIIYGTGVYSWGFDYIRAKYPGKLASCVIQGWSAWGKNLSSADKDRLVELSKHVDVIWDQGHRRTYIEPDKRAEFIARLHCDYGTSGGFWVYPPPRWNRLRWFFPYVHRTGQHLKELHAQS